MLPRRSKPTTAKRCCRSMLRAKRFRRWLARRAIGGFTGDVLGAVAQAVEVAVLLAAAGGERLDPAPHAASTFQPDEHEFGVAAWAFDKRLVVGRFTDTLPDAAAMPRRARSARPRSRARKWTAAPRRASARPLR